MLSARDTYWLHLNPTALGCYRLPDIAYPISSQALEAFNREDISVSFADMLHFLQTQSAQGHVDWRASEVARSRLAELLAPPDERAIVTAAALEWWLEIGQVDLQQPVITIQREDALISAMQSRMNGTLRVATYRPLDAVSARLLINLALRAHTTHGTVCMRADNWEYALDCAAGTGQTYAAYRKEAYLTYWPGGIGRYATGEVDAHWSQMDNAEFRPPAHVAIELGVEHAFGEG